MADEGQVAKLEKHLKLLRQEYVKLQNKMVEMEQKYSLAAAAAGQVGENTFVSRLLKTVAELFDKDLYSDITVSFAGKKVKSHKFVLAARSDHWSSRDLNEISELELSDVDSEVGLVMMKWVYTDKAEIPYDENFLIRLVKAANKYRLKALRERCEKMLMSSVSVANCIKYYQTAEDIGAKDLQKYCAEIISSHWHDLKTEDFSNMSAPLLYEMFKSKSAYPLHLAIRHHREDVVFLFVIEFNSQLPGKLNELDPSTGQVPLFIALVEQQDSIARTLVGHGCDVTMADIDGQTLLHKAIKNGDEFAATFLIQNGSRVSAATHSEHVTPLHLAASYRPWSASSSGVAVPDAHKMTSAEGMARIVSLLIEGGANTDAQDNQGRTPLHKAIESKNEPVISVLLQKAKLNLELRDNEGRVPLWLALSCRGKIDPLDEENLPAKLVRSGASPDAVNTVTGDSLLHMAASSGNEEAGLFLAPRGTDPNHNNKLGETPLHLSARKGLSKLVASLLNNGANPNAQTVETERTKAKAAERMQARAQAKLEARNRAIEKSRELRQQRMEKRAQEAAEKRKRRPQPKSLPPTAPAAPTSTVPQAAAPGNPFEEDLGSFGSEDADNPFLADIRAAASAAAAFTGTNPFDDPSSFGSDLTGDVATEDEEVDEENEEEDVEPSEEMITKLIEDYHLYRDPYTSGIVTECHGRTPLHMAIAEKHESVVNCIIEFQDSVGRGGRIQIVPDFDLVDSEDQTALELALWTGQYQVAERLLEAGAGISGQADSGFSLLHKAVKRGDSDSALFLLEHGADINTSTNTNQSPLQLAIQCRLQPVVEALCSRGADLNICDELGSCPLWAALKSEQRDIASTLVRYGCDTDAWSMGPNGCTQSLLHRAIAERDETAACFLIRSNCDINSPRRPGPGGDGGVEAWDGMSPLHLSCAAGVDNVVQCLVEYKANVNSKDSEGRSPAHIAIAHKHPIVIQLLLSHPELIMNTADRSGQTLFAASLAARINEAASAILAREPGAAEQFDNRGRNYLHSAILSKDVDTVLFLVGVNMDVNSPIQDSTLRTPLHLAVSIGSEIIVRHLLLAGASVNDVDRHKQSALQMAAAHDHPKLMSILLEHGVNADAVDEKYNNALHVAVQCGHVNCVRVLLTESSINAEAINARGQNPMHILAQYAKDNAVAIFELFRQSMPDYPMNSLDADENTALFLAYTNGAARLCREILRAGGSLATINKYGVSIFNAQVPTKKLLFTLLDLLNAEPPWSDGPTCHECGVKFTVKTRKHHCRHCGRLLCSKCSSKQIPIVKYELAKPVRVCDVCFDMLTTGAS